MVALPPASVAVDPLLLPEEELLVPPDAAPGAAGLLPLLPGRSG